MHLWKRLRLAIAASLAFSWCNQVLALPQQDSAHEVRIGVDQAAPYQSWREGYGPVGFTVDVLNAAAAKRHIRLHWINCPQGPATSIQGGKVDLWPLLSTKYGRELGFYVASPWLQNEYAVVWTRGPEETTRAEPDWKNNTISVLNSPRNRAWAASGFKQSVFDLTPNRTEALQHMCTGRSMGAFMEIRLLEQMLFRRPAGCEGLSLGVRVFAGMSDLMSLVATPPFKAEADALREEIGQMFLDGRFGRLADNWFVFSNVEANSMMEVQRQQKRNRTILAVLVIMAFLMLGLLLAIATARRARRLAETANAAKSTFLANVSHEVRTPMNGVLGMCDLLSLTSLTAEQRDYTTTIAQSARIQLHILNELLDSAKIEAGKLILEAIPFSPVDVVKEVERTFRGEVVRKGLDFTVTCNSVPDAVLGDPFRVRQIVTNLLNNAIKFTESGGITITLQGGGRDGEGLLLTVADTGIGIPSETQMKLFGKFVQVDEATTRRFGGTGLGLSICRDLARLMGGSIAVESVHGKGTTFRVVLPLPTAEPAARQTAAVDIREIALSSALPLLIVEDNLVNQKIAVGMLKSLGLQFKIASNGRQAVDLCACESFGAVLMDCQMPEMDGLEATRRIRASGSNVPILAMTASATASEQRLAFESGMDDFLPKPISRNDLRAMLERWLQPGFCTPESRSRAD